MSLPDTMVREAWLWLGGSLLLAILWANLTWLFSPWAAEERSEQRSTSLAERIVFGIAHWRFAPSLFQGLRLLYYVGLPSAALFWGRDAVVSRLLGLQRLALPNPAAASGGTSLNANWSNWTQDLGWTAVIGLSSGALLHLAAFAHRQALSTAEVHGGGNRTPAWKAAREAAYHEVHWAFYRNAPIVALGSYWGTWAGLGLVALEAAANPAWREDLRKPGQAWPRLSRAALAVISTVLFLRTQNLWLALALHWATLWTLEVVYGVPQVVPPADGAASGP